MDRILRPSISGRQSSWLAANQLAEFVEELQLLGCYAGLRKHIAESKLGKFAHRRRLQIDAHSQGGGVAHCLKHADRDAGLMQAERQAQPANATTDNNDFHILHFAATRGSLTLLKVTNSILRSSPSTFSTLRM